MVTNTLKALTIAIKKPSSNILRDFSELEDLVGNPTSAAKFASHTNKHTVEAIYKDLLKIKPDYNFYLLDEYMPGSDKSNTIYIQGILGLRNFSHSLPNFCLSVYLERDGKPHAAVIYNPVLNYLFAAEIDNGAYFNHKRLVFKHENNPYLYLATDQAAMFKNKDKLCKYKACSISKCPALDLCNLAANKFTNINLQNSYPKNMLESAILIAKEAKVLLHYNNVDNNITDVRVNIDN